MPWPPIDWNGATLLEPQLPGWVYGDSVSVPESVGTSAQHRAARLAVSGKFSYIRLLVLSDRGPEKLRNFMG